MVWSNSTPDQTIVASAVDALGQLNARSTKPRHCLGLPRTVVSDPASELANPAVIGLHAYIESRAAQHDAMLPEFVTKS